MKNKNKKESKREKIKIEEVLPVKKEEQSLAFARDSTNLLIRAYCDAFKLKYKTNPPIDGKTVGLAKNLLKHISLERAQNLIQVYLQMEDSWFKNKHHDFVTFTQNLNKIQVAMNNGKETKEGDIDWDKFWKDVGEKEVSDGTRSLPNPNKTT
ncbi:MAG TPA: hypothetical protein PK473_03105 [Nitrosomonas sp.]|nr:hypothetical protein [Agitococcus sp.]HNA69999.1 hypothetical protein [Nitrosomonas sp.]